MTRNSEYGKQLQIGVWQIELIFGKLLMRFFLLLVALIVSPSALADSTLLWLDDGVNLKGKHFEIASVTAIDHQTEDLAVMRSLQKELIENLIAVGVPISSATGEGGDRVILDCRVMRYAGGSVAGRWIGGRAGAAYIVVRVNLFDGESHMLMGDMVSVQEIAGGGLFSIGAEKTIVSDAAKEIANSIAQRVKTAH